MVFVPARRCLGEDRVLVLKKTMPELNLPLDHIGIAVPDIETAISDYARSFGLKVRYREKVQQQYTEIAFLTLANTQIELLAPLNKQGLIKKFLDTRGPGLHHICFAVSDIEAELNRLKKLGYELIDSKPRKGAENTLIAFIHPKSMGGVLLELCQH